MKLSLGPRMNEFYDLLAQSAAVAHEAARQAEIRFRDYPSPSVSQDDIKRIEHEGDRITVEFVAQLNGQHITPFDRDDLFILAGAVDDVTDAIENASELLGLYGIESVTRQALDLCELLVRATEQLAQLLGRLKGLRGSAEEILTIKAIEDEADRVARAARAGLFKDDRIDPTIVIRWKDVYESLEDAVDACETAAHRVGNILVKNA